MAAVWGLIESMAPTADAQSGGSTSIARASPLLGLEGATQS